MKTTMTIAALQLNATVGALTLNAEKICSQAWLAFNEHQADLIITPELALTGYPPEDLLLRQDFMMDVAKTFTELCAKLPPTDVIIGLPTQTEDGKQVRNSIAYIRKQQVIAYYHKQMLPNDGVFDDKRYFLNGENTTIIDWHGIRLGLAICEDFWHSPVAIAAKAEDAELLITINASPFDHEKIVRREAMMAQRVIDTGLPLIYTACVGGQDELLYDGHSFALNADASLVTRAEGFKETMLILQAQKQNGHVQLSSKQSAANIDNQDANTYQALVLALHDYIHKNHVNDVLLGLSGGIDSALVACIAADALGPEHVTGVLLPSQYTQAISNEDALILAKKLGINTLRFDIEPLVLPFHQALMPVFQNQDLDKTAENIQARCRGLLLMALSNQTGALLLATSNKSETAVGYATLYGDMAGGFSPIKDVYKTEIYRLAAYRNKLAHVIPERSMTRPPSAELRPNQQDSDSLPDYSTLDDIIYRFIELKQCETTIIAAGYSKDTVVKVIRMIIQNEYKRRQSAIGPRVTHCAFGKERRMPITQGFFE